MVPSFSDYDDAIRLSGLPPNFFISREYWDAVGWSVTQRDGILWVSDREEALMLPPMILATGEAVPAAVWAGFPGYEGTGEAELLDCQFIYDPKTFLDLSGGARQVFRKNVRRFRREHPQINYRKAAGPDELLGLFGEWLGVDEDREVYDAEGIMEYLEHVRTAMVLEEKGQPIGMNAWDENHRFINFRYSFAVGLPRISEFLRWLFYTTISRMSPKQVNDGGSLGSETLHRFKTKLGPKAVNEIYSWKG